MRTLSTLIAMALWAPTGCAWAQDTQPPPPAAAERGVAQVKTSQDAAPTTLTAPDQPVLETLADAADSTTEPGGQNDQSPDEAASAPMSPTKPEKPEPNATAGTGEVPGDDSESVDGTADDKAQDYPATPTVDPQAAQQLSDAIAALTKQVDDLRKEVAALRDREGDLTRLRDQIATLEADLRALRDENRTLADRLKTFAPLAGASGDGAAEDGQQQRLLFRGVDARVRFDNHEPRDVRINVNGTWHTLQPGENWIRVPYGPVTVHRYVGAEPRVFDNWTADPAGNGTSAVMAFDVGEPPAK
jgi:hypothetical protein